MRSLSLSIIVIPGIAILLDIFFYVFLLRSTAEKKIFKRFVISIILLAFFFNIAWEILQMPLYKARVYGWYHILFCVLASIADVIMVLLIYFGLAWIYKDALWIKNLKPKRLIFLMLIGGVGAVLAELRHLSIGTWSYAEAMPLIPVIHVGLSPVLQFMILPILIYSLSFKIVKKMESIR